MNEPNLPPPRRRPQPDPTRSRSCDPRRGPPPAPCPSAEEKRRVPIWLKVVGVLLLLLGLLVLFAPTIASTGPVRNRPRQGQRISTAGSRWRLVARMDERDQAERRPRARRGGAADPHARLADDRAVARWTSSAANYSLGEAVVDGLDFQLRREADGEINFAKLAKADAGQPADARSTEARLPNRSPRRRREPSRRSCPTSAARSIVRNSKGSYEDVVKRQTVQFPSIDGNVKIPTSTRPIENTLTVVAVARRAAGDAEGQRHGRRRRGQRGPHRSGQRQRDLQVEGLGMSAVAALLPPAASSEWTGMTNATSRSR